MPVLSVTPAPAGLRPRPPVSPSPLLGPDLSLAALGQGVRLDPKTGYLQLNTARVEAFVAQGARAVPPLYRLLSMSQARPQILEGLYLAQRLAEQKTPGVRSLYAAAARFNDTTDPLIQIYLAGFYRQLNAPESFGPTLDLFLRASRNRPASASLDPREELGGTLLSLITQSTANEVSRRLQSPRQPMP